MPKRIQTFTLSKRGDGHLWLKPENECSFSDETLLQVIEAEPILDLLEGACRFFASYTFLDEARVVLRQHGRLLDV